MNPVRFYVNAVFTDAVYTLGCTYGFTWKVGGRTRVFVDKYATVRVG